MWVWESFGAVGDGQNSFICGESSTKAPAFGFKWQHVDWPRRLTSTGPDLDLNTGVIARYLMSDGRAARGSDATPVSSASRTNVVAARPANTPAPCATCPRQQM